MQNLFVINKNKSRIYYISSINRVIDFIEDNLDSPLDLQRLSKIANFSPFHFHRIFLAIKGETLNSFIRRKRLEKSASFLISSNKSISEISALCGFTSNASFSRAFNDFFCTSATRFREGEYVEFIKKLGTKSEASGQYFKRLERISDKVISNQERLYKEVVVRDLKAITVAYCRHTGKFENIGKAFEKLMRWAAPRGLIGGQDFKVLTVYHDDPKVTSIENVQQSACISIDENYKVDGEVGKMNVAGGKYAMARFEITENQFTEAWTSLCAGWLPESGYECDERLPFELFHNNHLEHPQRKFILDICIPVRPIIL